MSQAWSRSPRVLRSGCLLLLLAIAPFFFLGGPDWASPRLYRALWSAGHYLFFALLTAWVMTYRPLHRVRDWLLLTLVVILLSLVIELVQGMVGRNANWRDGLSNLVGAWFALFWLQPARPMVWLGRALATVLLVWQLLPLGQTLINSVYQAQRFPVLADFESPREMQFWSGGERVSAPSVQGHYSLAFHVGHPDIERHHYTGVTLHTLAGDWRGYEMLAFELHAEREVTLTLRINDRHHDRYANEYDDRFNQRLTLEPGWNAIRIPLEQVRSAPRERRMNMQEVQRLLLFTAGLAEPHRLHLDHLRLE